MRYQFTGAGNLPRRAKLGMLGQPGCRIAEKLIHSGGRVRVVGRNVVPRVSAVLFRLRCPNDPHLLLAT